MRLPPVSAIQRGRRMLTAKALQPRGWASWWAYPYTVVLTLTALWLQLALRAGEDPSPMLMAFVVSILLGTHAGGWRTGMLATLLACLLAAYCLLPPLHRPAIGTTPGLWALVWLGLSGAIASALLAAARGSGTSTNPGAGEARFRAYVDQAADAMFVHDAAGRLTDVNRQACVALGHTREQLLRLDLSQVMQGFDLPRARQAWQEMQPGQLLTQQVRLRRRDGSAFPAEVRVGCIELDDQRSYLAMARDTTELHRMTRLYDALSQVNQAIVWSRNRQELLDKTCEVLVRHGKLHMAWVGWEDPATHRLVPAAVFGDESAYVQSVEVYSDDRPEGRGPSGTAFRSNRPYISNRMLDDPLVRLWRADIERRGFRSSASFPVRMGDEVCAVLSVYSDEPEFFQDREIALLEETAGDLSFTLDTLAREEQKQAADARARSEKLFSDSMIDSMPGIVYFYDEAGTFLRWNKNFERASGYSAEEITGMRPLEFFAPEDRALLQERIAEVFAHGESSVEAPFLSKSGASTHYLFTGRRVVLEGKACLVGMGIDITERKRAEAAWREAEERLELVVEHLGEGLVIAAPDDSLLHWNPESLRLLGFTDLHEARRRQREFGDIFETSTLDGVRLDPAQWPLARTRRGDPVEGLELRVRRRDIPWDRLISFNGRRVEYGEGKYLAFMTLNDITDRKQAERALLESHDELEVRIAERTRDLQSALVAAEAADRVKSAFLATMSHELRTPLNSIIGFTGILLQELAGPLNEEQTKQLGMVRGSARHLLDLISDVLDISKIEAGQMEVRNETFDLHESLEQVVASVRPMAGKKQLSVALDIDPALREMTSDRRRVEQVLLNLLNNAIKFTERGGVALRARLLPATAAADGAARMAQVCMQISDTGIGIHADDLQKLFQPFHQIDSGLTRQHEGTGLGLAICRRLSFLLGGDIDASSIWGEGSTFTVTLPLNRTGRT
ncbi:PAS domain S-box protein [Rhodanobacter sp. T12-5]|uniref:PAS domain S-box protein n=1 Tax=Rhodanobacter sp. T12-5 TaxID=2024611 RepID=UPI0015621805|nr:PAS domain S-box protein [Rhodanobacter sp. T12-5]